MLLAESQMLVQTPASSQYIGLDAGHFRSVLRSIQTKVMWDVRLAL